MNGRIWSLSPFPRPSNERGPADSASNTSQYSVSAWGSQPPEGGMFLPCCFAFMVECRWATWKTKSTPMPRHSYRERDHALGRAIFKLPGLVLTSTEYAQQEEEEIEEIKVERERAQNAKLSCQLRTFALDTGIGGQAGNLLGIVCC